MLFSVDLKDRLSLSDSAEPNSYEAFAGKFTKLNIALDC